MTARVPSAPLSPAERRQALRQHLTKALAQADAQALYGLTGQWVHRYGVQSLEPLVDDLADGEQRAWWHQLMLAPPAAKAATLTPAAEALLCGEPEITPEPALAAIPEPSSEHQSSEVSPGQAPDFRLRLVTMPPPGGPQPVSSPAPSHPALDSLRAWLSTPDDQAHAA